MKKVELIEIMTKETLKETRLRLGLTQRKIAKLLNVHHRTYEAWEQGRRSIPGILEVALRCIEKEEK